MALLVTHTTLLDISCHNSILCYVCLVFVMVSRLFIAAFLEKAMKGLTSWLLFVVFNYVFVTFPCGILGQAWYTVLDCIDF